MVGAYLLLCRNTDNLQGRLSKLLYDVIKSALNHIPILQATVPLRSADYNALQSILPHPPPTLRLSLCSLHKLHVILSWSLLILLN